MSSPYNAEGKLTGEAITLSREIMPAYRFAKDSRIPSAMAKYSTRSHESPYGNYSAHLYMNPKANEVFYEIDYKSVFDKMFGVPK